MKLVIEASAAVCGAKARDGFICVRIESRQMMFCQKIAYINAALQYQMRLPYFLTLILVLAVYFYIFYAYQNAITV